MRVASPIPIIERGASWLCIAGDVGNGELGAFFREITVSEGGKRGVSWLLLREKGGERGRGRGDKRDERHGCFVCVEVSFRYRGRLWWSWL